MAAEPKYDFDLIVVGGGSGGLAAAKEAARAKPGLRVACFDWVDPSPQGTKWGLGGTCVNVGCIPKKLFHGAGTFREALHQARNLGWQVGGAAADEAAAGAAAVDDNASAAASENDLPMDGSDGPAAGGAPRHDWQGMLQNVNMYIRSLNFAYKGALRSAGVTYINGKARFVGPNTVEFVRRFKTDTERLTAEHFMLAPGGRPAYPDVPGARELGITSDDIFWRKQAPGKTLVVGASYIALECAGFLHELGYDTTVLVRSILLRGFDQQVASQIGEGMERSGVRFVRPAVPVSLARSAETGRIRVEYRRTDGQGPVETEEFDTVLFAIGRTPNTADLGLDTAGVELDASGRVKVDAAERTSAPHIYAIGDVIAGPEGSTKRPELTPVAIQAGQLLARRLYAGAKQLMDYDLVPTAVFTPLEYGACGLSQEAAEAALGAANVDCYVSRFNALENGVGEHHAAAPRSSAFIDRNLWARQHTKAHGGEWEDHEVGSYEYDDRAGQYSHNNLLAKLVVDKSRGGRVVGLHYLGPHAGEITQGFSLALRLGATKEHFDQLVGIHPTLAEEFTVMATTLASGDNFMKKEGCGGGGSCG